MRTAAATTGATVGRRPREARAVARALETWYAEAKRDLPWRRTRDPYRIWIAEMMLQQTTVRAVIPYYTRFLKTFPTVRALARAPLPRVLAAWSGLGYYRRARHLHAAARRVVEVHGGILPEDDAALRALPGIGRYTSGAIRSIAFGAPAPILDGNVARVLARLHALRGPTASHQRRLWDEAAALVAVARAPGVLNQALMELGALVCAPERPACGACPLRLRCGARAAGAQEAIPAPRRRRAPVDLTQIVALVERRGRYLMRRRDGAALMEGLWEFPALGDGGIDGLRLRPLEVVARLRHSITYRNIRVEVRRARLLAEPRGGAWRWVAPAALARLPVSSLVTKVLGRVIPARLTARPGNGVRRGV
jgi:A/G-specific adenine glycosylase